MRVATRLVRVETEHVPKLGAILYEAFRDIAESHGFPRDFPSADMAQTVIGWLARSDRVYGVAALVDGKLAGSSFSNLILTG